MPNKIRVDLADDHPMFRAEVVKTLAAESEFEVIGEGVNGDDAVRLTLESLPGIILLALSMPDGGIATACPVVEICAHRVGTR